MLKKITAALIVQNWYKKFKFVKLTTFYLKTLNRKNKKKNICIY